MFYTRDFLNSVAEECREYDGCPDNEEAGSYQREDMLGDSVFARVHLDVYLECGYDRKTSCNRVNDVLDIEHHRHHIVVHGSQCVRSPRVVHAAAFSEDGTREQRTQCACTAPQSYKDWRR